MAAFTPKPFGKYFLVDKIAIGGMAEIYKAKTFGVDGFEKLLAIKKILPHYSADKEFISMLTDEAKLVVRLSHTNIVQIYDLGKVGDDYYISMEFIDGVNLREIITRAKELKEKIPLPLCLYILSEICKGLDYAHGKRDDQGEPLHIVHRDVSPQNILISFEGETKIVDFGIAKAALNISHTSAGILKGKVTYMSPEQALGKPIDGRTDIFSAGIILYELITGERLFAGDSQIDILNKIRSAPISGDTLKNIPDEVRPILAKALAFQLKDRYETAGDFQIALTKLLYSKYSDFSSKGLSGLIKKLFANELKIRKKRAIEEASIGADAKQELEKFANQKSLLESKSDTSILMADTTRPEDKLSAAMFTDTSKPEDKISNSTFEMAEKNPISASDNEEHARTQLKIASGLSENKEIEGDQPTSKSISVHFKKKEAPGPGRFLKTLKIFLSLALILVIIWGIYTYNPVSIIHQWVKDLLKEHNPIIDTRVIRVESERTQEKLLETTQEKEEIKKIDLLLETNIPGALIYKNGENTGLVTPNSLKDLPTNEKVSVILRKEDYEDLVFDIDPSKITNTTLHFDLKAIAVPEQVKKDVVIDQPIIKEIPIEDKNKIQENKESDLPIESKEVQKPDKTTQDKPVEKSESQKSDPKKETPVKKPVNKEPKKEIIKEPKVSTQNTTNEIVKNIASKGGASIRVDSSPRGAAVTINGKKAGITPVVLPNLVSGSSHSISLSLPGYKPWSRSVSVGSSRIEVNASLQKD